MPPPSGAGNRLADLEPDLAIARTLNGLPREVRYTNAISAAPSLLHSVSSWIVLK